MSNPNDSSGCDESGANIAFDASLIDAGKSSRRWRLATLYIRISISLTKATRSTSDESEQSPLSSVPYAPLPPSPSPPTRTSSVKSSCTIDVVSDNEEDARVVSEQRIKNDIARIVKEKDLKSLLELGGVPRVRSVLARRQSEECINDNENNHLLETTEQVQRRTFSYCFWSSCKRNGYTFSLLFVSALLSLFTGIVQEGPKYGWHDGVATFVTLFMLVAFASVANLLRERKMLKLSEKKGKLKVTVVRGENRQMVAISDIMVGDIVSLNMGDEVPADGLLLSNENSGLDEAQNPFLVSGSEVLFEGHMFVTSVRDNSAEMQNSVANDPEKITLLGSRIEKPISYSDKVALLISAVVALVVLIRLISKKNGDSKGLPETKGKVSVDFLWELLERILLKPQGKVPILTGAITVGILSMQYMVPLMVTISLKYHSDKVVSNQAADLHDLSACATMGLVTVICIDASVELMYKLMEVSRIRMGERDISNDVKSETNPVVHEVLQRGASVSVLVPELILSPVSNSLFSWAETTWGGSRESFSQNLTILQHSNQNSFEEGSGVLVRKVGDNEQLLHLHWSGAASTILDMCSQYYDSNGECQNMENQKILFEQVIKDMEDDGLEPIALAYRQIERQELKRDGLILLALLGLKRTCPEEIKLALAELTNDGIKIKLVSRNDDIMAVRAIACELGIEIPLDDGVILEGKEIQDLIGTGRSKKLDKAVVMGGFLPEHKVLMVRYLQDNDHVVACVEGSTVNDTAVLNAADVGILDNSLTPITDRECSNISIKSFSAITTIVRAGRCQYHNIQKFIQIHLTAGISWLLITLITTMCIGESPLTAVQLIWVNVVMCLLGGLMMVIELNTKEEQHANQPYNRKESLITQEIWKNIAVHVLYQAFVSMIFQFGGKVTDSKIQVRKTMIFNTFMLCQVFNQLSTMHLLKKEIFKIVLQSYYFLVALGASLIMQVLVIQYADSLADYMRLNATQWAICTLVSALSWVFEWLLKFLPVILEIYGDSLAITSPFGVSSRWRLFGLSYLGISFLVLIFFSVPYKYSFNQAGQPLR